jgi:type VI protein secretion system component Hcp
VSFAFLEDMVYSGFRKKRVTQFWQIPSREIDMNASRSGSVPAALQVASACMIVLVMLPHTAPAASKGAPAITAPKTIKETAPAPAPKEPVIKPKPKPQPKPRPAHKPVKKPIGATPPPVLAPTMPKPSFDPPTDPVPKSADVPTPPSGTPQVKQAVGELDHTADMQERVRDIFGPPGGSAGNTRRRGDVILDDITTSKELEKATPKIAESITKGKVFPKVELNSVGLMTADGRPDTPITQGSGLMLMDPDEKPWDPTDKGPASDATKKGKGPVGGAGASARSFLKVEGIDGESKDDNHGKWIDLAPSSGDMPQGRRGDVFPKVELNAKGEAMLKWYKPGGEAAETEIKWFKSVGESGESMLKWYRPVEVESESMLKWYRPTGNAGELEIKWFRSIGDGKVEWKVEKGNLGGANAQSFLKIEGVDGESKDDNHGKWIDLAPASGDMPQGRRGDVFPKVDLDAEGETMIKWFKNQETSMETDSEWKVEKGKLKGASLDGKGDDVAGALRREDAGMYLLTRDKTTPMKTINTFGTYPESLNAENHATGAGIEPMGNHTKVDSPEATGADMGRHTVHQD